MRPTALIALAITPIILSLCCCGQKVNGKKTQEDTALISRNQYINEGIAVDSNNVPIDLYQYYFPLVFFPKINNIPAYKDSTSILLYKFWGVGGDTIKVYGEIDKSEFDTSSVAWPSLFLRNFSEPLLFNRKTEKETYRFTWLRTFDNPICIRIEKCNDQYNILWKVNDGKGGYAPGPKTVENERSLQKEDWEKFQVLLDSLSFWNKKNIRELTGLDGSTWVLEGSTPNRYQVLDAWSPPEGSSFYRACDFLIELTDMDIKDKY